jgi:NifU-like protein involved in Fe-S cluster formation
MKYESPITYHSKDMANVKVFEKWVKRQGQSHKVKKNWYLEKGLVIRKTHMKYESPITYHSKNMANVKVCEKWVKLQGQGCKVKNYGTIRKFLT